jgi:uracil phosphoribosyltransferase
MGQEECAMPVEHRYGANVHLPGDPWLYSLLARVGDPLTGTRDITDLIRTAYRRLCAIVLAGEFPVVQGRVKTRMAEQDERGYYEGPLFCPESKLVVVAIARGGLLPAQTCYEAACQVLPPENVRMDFLNMARTTDKTGRVTGVHFDGSKIGGPVSNAVVLIPDPMGATGGTVARTLDIYKDIKGGDARRYVCVHLMVTPEAIQRLQATHPDTRIYGGRLDRGLSPEDVLKTVPGTHPDRERGLNDLQYIVPGAGGIGELLTNSWV